MLRCEVFKYQYQSSSVTVRMVRHEWLQVIVVPVRCPHAPTACKMASLIRVVKSEHDSIGGTVIGHVSGMPIGFGEPCFDKLEVGPIGFCLPVFATVFSAAG